MIEYVVRASGPLLLISIEVEGPTRLVSTANDAEAARLDDWIEASPLREAAVAAALADRSLGGGVERQLAWGDMLAREPGGIVAAVAELVERITPTHPATL